MAEPRNAAEVYEQQMEADARAEEAELKDFVTVTNGEPEPSEEGEWVSFAEGMRLRGRLERAFFVTGDKGGPRPAYAIRDAEGALWLVSERKALEQFRECVYGQEVYFRCKEKAELGKQKTIWRLVVKIGPKPVPTKGERTVKVRDVLMREYERLEACPF